MAGRYNLDIKQGDAFSRDIKWTHIYGGLIGLTKYTPKMQIRTGSQEGTVLLELTSGAGISIASDVISIVITGAQSSALTIGRHFYSLVLTRTDGFIVRVIDGYVNVA